MTRNPSISKDNGIAINPNITQSELRTRGERTMIQGTKMPSSRLTVLILG